MASLLRLSFLYMKLEPIDGRLARHDRYRSSTSCERMRSNSRVMLEHHDPRNLPTPVVTGLAPARWTLCYI